MIVPNYFIKDIDTIPDSPKRTQYRYVNNYQSYSRIKFLAEGLPETVKPSETFTANLTIETLAGKELDLSANPAYPARIMYYFFKDKELVKMVNTKRILSNEDLANGNSIPISIISPELPGSYSYYISLRNDWLPPTINGKRFEITVE